MTTLAKCLQDILCGLGNGTKQALTNILREYIALVDLEIVKVEASLVTLSILTAPVEAVETLVTTAISEAKSAANLIPFDLASGCLPVNDLTTAIQSNLDAVLASAINISNDLQRYLSLRDELEAALEELQRVRDLYVSVVDAFQFCP